MLGWEIARLDDACVFINGLWKGKKPPFVEAGVIRNTNFSQDGALDFSDIAYLDVEVKQIEKRRLQLGDIILEKSGGGPKQAVGRVALFNRAEENFSFSNFTSAIRIRDAKKLDYRYLHKFLHWIYVSGVTESMQSHSTGIRNLNGDAYKNIEIAIPALKEQQRIVAILDEAFAGIAISKASAEKNLQDARRLFESYLDSAFTRRGTRWLDITVSELAEHSLGKMLDKAKNRGEPEEYLRNVNVRWFEFELEDLRQMRFMGREREKYTAARGDLVICEGGYPGRAAIWDQDEPIYIQKALHRVRFYEPAHAKWVLYYLFSQSSSGLLKQHFSGTGIQHFTGAALARFKVPVAPVEVVNAAIEKFDTLRVKCLDLEDVYRRKLAALDDLKHSLLAKAFAGEL